MRSYTNRGRMTQHVRLKIDLSTLIEMIMEKADSDCDNYDWEVDGDELEIMFVHTTGYKHYHCDATLYDPPEDDWELYDDAEDIQAERAVLEAMHEMIKINTRLDVENELDDCEYDPY